MGSCMFLINSQQSFELSVPGDSLQSPLIAVRSSSDGKCWSLSTFANRAKAVFLEDEIPTSVHDNVSRNTVESPRVDQVCVLSFIISISAHSQCTL